MSNLSLKYKIWLDSQGKVFGEGPYKLLNGVENLGSLSKAAKEMNMSYSLAHNLIKDLEERLGFPLIERQVGGKGGGGSQLTGQAKDLMQRYSAFMSEIEEELPKIFRKHFLE